MSKPKYRTINQRPHTNDDIVQQYIRNIQWSDDPRRNLAQLKRLVKELEADLGTTGQEIVPGSEYTLKNIKDARKWFRDEVKKLMATPWEVNHKRMSKYTRGQHPLTNIDPYSIGKMYFYGYDPKTKDTLPYYDIFPLILMVRGLDDGWYGLNLHYLPPKQREILIYRLMENMTNNNIDKNARIKMNYKMLSSVAKYRYFKPCFKRYLRTHVKTRVMPIPFNKWPNAILLPVANFKKAGITTVWADSLKQARGV